MAYSHEQYLSTLHSQPLTDSDLHVWCASLNASPNDLVYYSSLLSPDEKARAGRFYFEVDRHNFIVGRGLLRSMLGAYLNLESSQIEFVYGQYGKPALKSSLTERVLEFNLSHSKDLALYIFSWGRKVGIDIEYIYPMPTMHEFAKEFFSLRENRLLNLLPEEQRLDMFFKIWTCKEALLKANGFGLTVPINQVEISLKADGSAVLSSASKNEGQAEDWRLELFNPAPGYQAAFTVEGGKKPVTLYKLGPL